MSRRNRARLLPLLLAGALFGSAQPLTALQSGPVESHERTERLRGVRVEITRLQKELAGLVEREQGVLGQLERLGAELRLRVAESKEVRLRSEGVALEIAGRDRAPHGFEQGPG